jgi:hypothetical protein
MSLTSCSRHPDEPAKGLCGRCGDFLCAKCSGERSSGLCSVCAVRAPAPGRRPGASLALAVAVLCAVLSGGFLVATSGLHFAFAKKAAVSSVAYWNAFIGLVYFAIAWQLFARSPGAYGWSVQTQALNSALGGYSLYTLVTKPNAPTWLVALSSVSLAIHLVGWLATWLARHDFQRDD